MKGLPLLDQAIDWLTVLTCVLRLVKSLLQHISGK